MSLETGEHYSFGSNLLTIGFCHGGQMYAILISILKRLAQKNHIIIEEILKSADR